MENLNLLKFLNLFEDFGSDSEEDEEDEELVLMVMILNNYTVEICEDHYNYFLVSETV